MLTHLHKYSPDRSTVLLTLAATTGLVLASSLHAEEGCLTPVRLDEVTLPLMVMSAAGKGLSICNDLGNNQSAFADIDVDTLIRHSNLALSENAHRLAVQPIRSGRTMTHDLAQWLLTDPTPANTTYSRLLERLNNRCKAVLNPNAKFFVDLPQPNALMAKKPPLLARHQRPILYS